MEIDLIAELFQSCSAIQEKEIITLCMGFCPHKVSCTCIELPIFPFQIQLQQIWLVHAWCIQYIHCQIHCHLNLSKFQFHLVLLSIHRIYKFSILSTVGLFYHGIPEKKFFQDLTMFFIHTSLMKGLQKDARNERSIFQTFWRPKANNCTDSCFLIL